MSLFTGAEQTFLSNVRLGRLATVDRNGHPHVVPTDFNFNADQEVIEIGAHDLPGRGQNRHWRTHIKSHRHVAFVVDDFIDGETWIPMGIKVRGQAQILDVGGERFGPGFGPIWVRIVPSHISAWGIDTHSMAPPHSRKVA